MPAGSIVVELLAKTGSFDTDIDRSTKATEKRMREMQRTVETAGTAVGIAMTAAAVAAVAFAKHTVNGLDALNDVSDATGASIENISALEDTALRSGNSFESVTSALVKFNQQLKDTDPENKTATILEKIGLNADRLRQMDPAEALHQVARALAQFADDGDKARVVQELFGKSVREVAPMLKDLAEQEQLHATVTTAEAKAAEDFNKQLADMHKNSTDLARSIAGDLLPQVNALLRAYREGGVLGFLGVGGDQAKNPGAALAKINDELAVLRKNVADFGKANPLAQWWSAEDLPIMNAQIKALEAQQKYLKSLQQSQVLMGGGDTSDALSRRLGDRPGIGPLPNMKKEPKGPDPDADFKQYLNHLQEQIQKVGELTNMEKLLDDIRRGHLTVSPAQEAQLKLLAGEVDAEKEAMRIAKERQAQRNKDYEESAVALREIDDADRQRLKTLMDAGPAAQLERQRKEMQYLADAFQQGRISAEEFNDAATGYLHLTADSITQTKSLTEELGLTFASAFENAVIGGSGLSDIFKGLLQDIARVILRLEVVEPLMKQLKSTMGSDDGWWNSLVGGIGKGIGNLFGGGGVNLGGVTGADMDIAFAGAMAGGGDVLANRSYWVGEHGPEKFVPRTAGAIVPAGAAGGGNIAVINQTSGRVDSASEQRQPNGDRVVILRELAAELGNPNSIVSRAMTSNFNVRRHR
jgi:hypothetical protein